VTTRAGQQELAVILDPDDALDATGVEVTTFPLGDIVLVETVDPQGRYLPSAQFVTMTGEGLQQISAPQFPLDLEWGVTTSETEINIEPLMGNSLGRTTFAELGEILTTERFPNGVNLVFAFPEQLREEGVVEVYQTPLSHTVLLVPVEAQTGKAPGLAAPERILFMTVVVVAYTAVFVFSMVAPLVAYIYFQIHATVPDLIGRRLDYVWQEERHDFLTKGGEGFNFDYNIMDTNCDDPSRIGEIVAQEPPAGTEINALEDRLTLYVCSEVRVDYSDLESFLETLKRAIESENYPMLIALASDPLIGGLWFSEAYPFPHDELVDRFEAWDVPYWSVDISERGSLVLERIRESGIGWQLPVVLAEDFSESAETYWLLDIDFVDGRYYWTQAMKIDVGMFETWYGPFPEVGDELDFVPRADESGSGLEGFTNNLQDAIPLGPDWLPDLLANPVYLHPIGCIGECDHSPVSSLEGFVSPEEGTEYILACYEHLAGMLNTDLGITLLVYDPEPRQNEWVSSRSPVEDTLFFVGWRTLYVEGILAYPELVLGVGETGDGYWVTEASCYPFVQ
jgi:hypothetical protein